MIQSRRKLVARFVLAAMLFSALSPAMASVLFSDRPDILASLLALPAKPAGSAQGDICHTAGTAQQLDLKSQSDDAPGRTTHGIFCSFCLAASSVVTVPTAASTFAMAVVTATVFLPARNIQPSLATPASTRHPRDPPVALR